MGAPRSLARVSTVDALAAALRREVLDGERPGGARLRERELCAAYGVARHTLRAALRALAAEGLVRIEPNRGARVARLGPDDVRWLYELRAALEVEAAHLALERHGGRLPAAVHAAQAALEAACAGPDPAWSGVAEAHLDLHAALVEAAGSPRIAAAHAGGGAAAVPAPAAPARHRGRAGRGPRRAARRDRARRDAAAARAPARVGRHPGWSCVSEREAAGGPGRTRKGAPARCRSGEEGRGAW
jgi:DNA-binding GntR family transcriptional regulator